MVRPVPPTTPHRQAPRRPGTLGRTVHAADALEAQVLALAKSLRTSSMSTGSVINDAHQAATSSVNDADLSTSLRQIGYTKLDERLRDEYPSATPPHCRRAPVMPRPKASAHG